MKIHKPSSYEEYLDTWMACLKPGGVCIIEWSQDSSESFSNAVDVFGGSMEEYRALFEKKHRGVEVLTRSDYRPEDYGSLGQRWFLVLKNRNTPADN